MQSDETQPEAGETIQHAGSELEDVANEHDGGSGVDQALESLDQGASSNPPTSDERVLAAEQEVLRVRAEMENFRKRMLRDSEQQLKYAHMPLMRDLLDVVDNLQRAIGAASEDDPQTKALRDGVAMVSQQMNDVLSKHNCTPVEALGTAFDPNFHEAISQMPSEEYDAGTVMNEVGVGYLLHDRVVRPSHVIVSTGSANAGSADE